MYAKNYGPRRQVQPSPQSEEHYKFCKTYLSNLLGDPVVSFTIVVRLGLLVLYRFLKRNPKPEGIKRDLAKVQK